MAFVAAQVEHVPFLKALLRRLVAQFWDSFGRTVAVQLRFDAAVLTVIAAYVDRFMCRLRRGEAAVACLGDFAGDSGHPRFVCCLQAFKCAQA